MPRDDEINGRTNKMAEQNETKQRSSIFVNRNTKPKNTNSPRFFITLGFSIEYFLNLCKEMGMDTQYLLNWYKDHKEGKLQPEGKYDEYRIKGSLWLNDSDPMGQALIKNWSQVKADTFVMRGSLWLPEKQGQNNNSNQTSNQAPW